MEQLELNGIVWLLRILASIGISKKNRENVLSELMRLKIKVIATEGTPDESEQAVKQFKFFNSDILRGLWNQQIKERN